MADLHLTPARVAILRAVARGEVTEAWYTDQAGEIRQGTREGTPSAPSSPAGCVR